MAKGKMRVVDRDRGWRDFFARIDAARGEAYVKVGILGDTDRGGFHQPGVALSVAEIAAVHEFGTGDGRIPERSFLRSTFDAEQDELAALAARLFAAMLFESSMTAERALGLLGAALAAKVKASIVGGDEIPPPNAPSTLARKVGAGAWNRGGKAQASGYGPRTLVDTGRMVNAISWAVVIRGAQKAAQYLSGE